MALLPATSPRSLGYSMPPEWHVHEGTWISWPHNLDTWSTYLDSTEQALAQAVKWLSEGEVVHINVLDQVHEQHVFRILKMLGVTGAVQFHHVPTNDSWCRDHGAVFLLHPERPGYAAVDWGYNAWGGKYPPYDQDNLVPRQMCEAVQAHRFETPFVLEGGSIEVNGDGVLMTTETCLLNPNRNPGMDKETIEHVLWEMLGVHQIIWLQGELLGDDTDGHIDNLARFVNDTTIAVPLEANQVDAKL